MLFRAICLLSAFWSLTSPANAADPIVLHVNTFPTARSLPFYVAGEKGFFARHGLNVDLDFTQNSRNLRDGLASGKYDIVHSAADNAIDMIEVGKKDVVIVTGGDSGTNEFYVQAAVKDFADMRGRILVVDAPDTAYALQAKKILRQHGLKDGADYTVKPVGNGSTRLKVMSQDSSNAAGVLNLPYSLQAAERGMKSLGRLVDLLGPYQAGASYTLRPWAVSHSDALERYIAAFVESLRWSVDPNNRAESVALLVDRLKLSKPIAEKSYELMIDPAFGFAPDARFNMDGFKNVLALRAEIEGGAPAAPERYIDLSYYARAMKVAK